MNNYENNSLIYPANYDELAEKRAAAALQASLVEKIARPADAAARDLGSIAIQSVTGGILQPTFDTEVRTPELTPTKPKLAIALGGTSLRDYMLREAPSSVVTEEAMLGYATRQVA
jgi:hypothetical protein